MSPEEHTELMRLLKESNELARSNNELLRKLYRHTIIGLVLRFVWYGLLIGLPFALYYFLIEPYFNAFGANYELFKQGIGELPGLKGFEHIFPKVMD
jgi:hypothetical protein